VQVFADFILGSAMAWIKEPRSLSMDVKERVDGWALAAVLEGLDATDGGGKSVGAILCSEPNCNQCNITRDSFAF
jgi:hypothetical protein